MKVRRTGGIAAAVICAWLAPRGANAQPRPSEAPLPSCLDQSIADELGAQLKPRGVQKRDFRKDGKVALLARAGLFGGDLTSTSWIAGGSLGFFFTEDLGVELSFDLTPVTLDLDQPLAEFFGDDRFEPGMGYLGLANVVFSPIHTKIKTGGGIVHGDLLMFAGGGRLFHDSVQGVTFDAGLALDLFVTRVATFRFEAKNVMTVQEAVAQTRFTNNLVATAGVVFWIPTGL
ncbi:MAG: outer membrane beta-barrel domain-containing protein [Kofleriaceae bacterium]|jgi:outer membrane beta-barrel protein|nr:outer membrane beta-barrel domain-containing protein [Kofleriaceae bacterium]MBP6836678.1 outer membrane beta-barrel domain-containing protein [Kofleriaceae bacterium]